MKPRQILLIILAVVALVILVFGTCTAIVLYKITTGNQGPKHVFPLAGDGPLTDGQALDLSKQVMVLDGKSGPGLRPSEFGSEAGGDRRCVIRQPGSNDVRICWYEPISGKSTYVGLQRKSGEVIGRTQE